MIYKCTGQGCPFYPYCFRYLAKNEKYQLFLKEVPFDGEECNYFLSLEEGKKIYGGKSYGIGKTD